MLIYYFSLIDNVETQSFFEKIYYSYRKQMLYLARIYLKNEYDAEDAVHDVFEQIARKHLDTLRKITDCRDLRNYLLKATKNTCLNYQKKQKALISMEDLPGIEIGRVLSDEEFLEEICMKAEIDEIKAAIAELPDTYREVMYYHFVLELSIPEVAKLVGRKTDTVKKQMVRGKKKLLTMLGNIGGEQHAADASRV